MSKRVGRPTKPEKERAGYRAVNVRLNAKQWEHLNLARLMNGLPRESFIKDLIEKAPIPESIARALKETK